MVYFSLAFKATEPHKNCIIKAEDNELVWNLVQSRLPPNYELTCVEITESAVSTSAATTSIEKDTLVSVVVELSLGKHLVATIQPQTEKEEKTPQPKNAFDVLLNIGTKSDFLPEPRSVVHNKDRLYNAVRELLESQNVGFSRQNPELASNILKQLTDVLWYLDPHQALLKERGCKIPEIFESFQGFVDYRAQKKKKPVLHSSILEFHCETLGTMLLMPWMQKPKHKKFSEEVSALFDALDKMVSHMKCRRDKVTENRAALEPVRSIKDHWSIRPLTVGDESTSHPLVKSLSNFGNYEVIHLDGYLPSDRKTTKSFLDNLIFPYPVTLMTYCYGNYLGNTYFMWKTKEWRDDGEIACVNFVLENLPRFSTRSMRSQFLDKYASVAKPHILRNMWIELTNDATAPETEEQHNIDMRVVDYFLSADDPEVIVDLRKNNGNAKDPKFDVFWDKLSTILDEKSVVHERRKDETVYMPEWISVRDLREDVLSQCPEGTEAPSESWIRMNFQPTSPFLHSAVHYTGRLNIKFAVQQRLLRATHPDAKYCSVLWRYLKEFTIMWRDESHMIAVDDKAIVPVGEPNKPVSTNVRRHHRSLVSGAATLVALDHDYHTAGIVPSIVLHIVVPENKDDSFHTGKLVVTVKDKYFQPSNPMRHCAETAKTLQRESAKYFGTDELNDDIVIGDFAVPILAVYSDGGPDHNTTFFSVKLAAIALFVKLDLDFYVAVRCAPCQSYANPAERCMSVLNLPLQNVALSRSEMLPHLEGIASRLKTLDAVRNAAERNDVLKKALRTSVEEPIDILVHRFARMTYSGYNVEAFKGAEDDRVDEARDILGIFTDDGIVNLDHMKKHKQLYPKLTDFMDRHCRSRQYSFQIKKCLSDECWYCSLLHPPRLSVDDLQSLSWLPDPQKTDDGQWKPFAEVYRTETTDEQRPSLSDKPQSPEDTLNKALFVAGRVRGFIICAECGKRRCVYSKTQLTAQETLTLTRRQDSLIYTCGDSLFPAGDLEKKMVVRQAINCQNPTEVTYYSGVGGSLHPVCFHCGDTDVLDHQTHEGFRRLSQEFATVRPICKLCWDSGKRPATRNAVKVAKRKK